jgi:endonuclease/exonuclease/phosphatase family metal-dependent hydrolase
LFDTQDNAGTNDNEFIPGGIRGWTLNRLNDKLLKISKVILNAGDHEPPGLVGLCEIETRYVLERLLNNTPLKSFGYKIIHKDSPDPRGIDVALLYREKFFSPLKYDYFRVADQDDPAWSTREILYFSCVTINRDTLHLFINHWPSRSTGVLETIDKRELAAGVLIREIRRLQHKHHNPVIVAIGDFNDQPYDRSLSKILKAGMFSGTAEPESLYNLSYDWLKLPFGTHKFQSQWSDFDQVIVSGSLLDKKSKIYCTPGNARIYNPRFLLQNDRTYGGIRPFRTYSGYKYTGGFSDHLPVYLDLLLNQN